MTLTLLWRNYRRNGTLLQHLTAMGGVRGGGGRRRLFAARVRREGGGVERLFGKGCRCQGAREGLVVLRRLQVGAAAEVARLRLWVAGGRTSR